MITLESLHSIVTRSEECESLTVDGLRKHDSGCGRDTAHRSLGKNVGALGSVLRLSHGNKDPVAHKCPRLNIGGESNGTVGERLMLVDPIEKKMVELQVPTPTQIAADPLKAFRDPVLLFRDLGVDRTHERPGARVRQRRTPSVVRPVEFVNKPLLLPK
jgi:hypothetical protein